MNVLLFEDLFLTICLCLNMKQVINLELISKYHHLLIRKTTWFLKVNIKSEQLLNHIIKNYHFKNLSIFNINVDLYIDYLKNCHTLDLSYTNVTDVSDLKNCHTLNLSSTKVTEVSALKIVIL